MRSPRAALLLLTCSLLGCDPKTTDAGPKDASGNAAERITVFDAELELPAGWSGGQSDAGGYEFTDGQLALMIGRHPLSAGMSDEAFAEERSAALAELGKLELGARRKVTVDGRPGLVTSGASTEGIAVRLLTLRLDVRHGLSLLLVGDRSSDTRLDSALAAVSRGLHLRT